MIKEIFSFYKNFPVYQTKNKKSRSENSNTLISLKDQIRVIELKETNNIFIETKEKENRNTLIVLKIKNKKSFDRLGLTFEKINNEVYIGVMPYFITDFLKIEILDGKKNKISFKTYTLFKNLGLKIKVKDKEINFIIKNGYIKENMSFKLIEF